MGFTDGWLSSSVMAGPASRCYLYPQKETGSCTQSGCEALHRGSSGWVAGSVGYTHILQGLWLTSQGPLLSHVAHSGPSVM